jgi:hypothetical protein
LRSNEAFNLGPELINVEKGTDTDIEAAGRLHWDDIVLDATL